MHGFSLLTTKLARNAIPKPSEPKQQGIALALKALSHSNLGQRPRDLIIHRQPSAENASQAEVNRASSADIILGFSQILGRCPRLALNTEPLALADKPHAEPSLQARQHKQLQKWQ